MIPKVIHYCWFGRGDKPKLTLRCIESWKKYCPDYTIVEWNESNFDVSCNTYVKEAYDRHKYAFVTDYVRLFVLYQYGGIYMDTDVEVVGKLDCFLIHQAFSGFESTSHVLTSIMAGVKGFPLFKQLMENYDERRFINTDGTIDTTTNVESITAALLMHGLILNGEYQTVSGLVLYPRDYFCPYEDATGVLTKSERTVTIHWFNKSWVPAALRKRSRITRVFHRWFGVDCFRMLKR